MSRGRRGENLSKLDCHVRRKRVQALVNGSHPRSHIFAATENEQRNSPMAIDKLGTRLMHGNQTVAVLFCTLRRCLYSDIQLFLISVLWSLRAQQTSSQRPQ